MRVSSLVDSAALEGEASAAAGEWSGPVARFEDTTPDPEELAVDAVFGTGFHGALPEAAAALFDRIRETGQEVLAVDIPSGVNGNDGTADPHTLHAALTVTFFRKTLGHMLMPGMGHCGHVVVCPVGISPAMLEKTGFAASENGPNLWKRLPYPPPADSYKYARGHVVVLGGAAMTGAARLASEGAMRVGAGVCTIVAPAESLPVYRSAAPHVLSEPLTRLSALKDHLADPRRTAVVMGPGVGLNDKEDLRQAVLGVLGTGRKVVLDADALGAFTEDPGPLFAALHENCILTPHEGEFSRLFPGLEGHKVARVTAAVAQTGAPILLKGPDTVIAHPDGRVAVNTHASPWLATAGAGDVLAGMIAGMMALGLPPYTGAKAAVWIHGDAALRFGAGLTAPDVIARIPEVLQDIIQHKTFRL